MMNLSEKKVAELREIAKGMNIPKYYSLKKETLIQSIQEIQMKLEEAKRLEETMNRNTLNGATRNDVTEYYIRKLGKNLDYAKALTRALYDDESANDMKLVFETYQEKLSWKKAPKRSQWDCIQVNVSTVKDLTFNSNEAVSIRNFGSKKEAYDAQAIVTVPVSITRAKKVADSMNRDLLIFKAIPFNPLDAVDETALQSLLHRIYHNGITDVATGRHYLPAVQSASQARQGALWFFEANSFDEVDEFRLKCLRLTKEKYQELFGDHVLMSKLEARVGLAVSNTLDMNDVCLECRSEDFINVINSLNVKVVDDVYVDTKFNAILPVMGSQGLFNGQTMLKEDFHANMNVSDGCGLMSVSTTIKINYGLHLITHEEFVRATNEWEKVYNKDLNNVTDKECWFRKFVLRMSKVVQFRHAGDKGIIVMANMEAEGIEEDILLHRSVRKYDCGEWNDAPFEICMYDKPKTGMANLNFQFIQALNIKANSLIELADRHLNNITNNILQDAKVAMKFLGMVNRIGQDDDSENLSSTRKLETVLRTDPLMIKDAQVQKWLMEKVKKFISDLAIGRIPVEGAYYYIVTDPRYLMSAYTGKPLKHLQAGQYYLNGREGKCAGFRSPLIYWGEAQLLDCIEDEGLWYYTDLVIFNPYDGKAPAMGGAK